MGRQCTHEGTKGVGGLINRGNVLRLQRVQGIQGAGNFVVEGRHAIDFFGPAAHGGKRGQRQPGTGAAPASLVVDIVPQLMIAEEGGRAGTVIQRLVGLGHRAQPHRVCGTATGFEPGRLAGGRHADKCEISKIVAKRQSGQATGTASHRAAEPAIYSAITGILTHLQLRRRRA